MSAAWTCFAAGRAEPVRIRLVYRADGPTSAPVRQYRSVPKPEMETAR